MATLVFRINYWTQVGENVAVLVNGDLLSNSATHDSLLGNRIALTWRGEGNWEGALKISSERLNSQTSKVLAYKFAVVDSSDRMTIEKGPDRILDVQDLQGLCSHAGPDTMFLMQHSWLGPASVELKPRLNASIFTDVVFRRDQPDAALPGLANSAPAKGHTLLRFRVHNVFVPRDFDLYVCGASACLGSWNIAKAVKLSDAEYPRFMADVQVPNTELPLVYKYALVSKKSKNTIYWEPGTNRYFDHAENPDRVAVCIVEEPYRIGNDFKGAGVVLPIFSLRSAESVGIGEFADLPLLFDWASKAGIKLVQILPVNDTLVKGNFEDSYPYNALSVFALNPVYIRLQMLTTDNTLLKEIDQAKKTLDIVSGQETFQKIVDFKFKILTTIFNKEKAAFEKDPAFLKWFGENKKWLAPYALYVVFKKQFKTYDFAAWPQYSKISQKEIDDLTKPTSNIYQQVLFQYFIQYHLHCQLHQAVQYGKSRGVALKGDIAIGVSPKSVDTWCEPKLFRLNKSTGAPPDFFAEDGQNWGFPTYEWDEMEKDGFAWWKRRLEQMAQYFQAFRIDHILGFFRIWEIPRQHVTGMFGRFNPSNPVSRGELEMNGLWDIDRLTKPYIRWHLLKNLFFEHAEAVAAHFFDDLGQGFLKFKDQFSTEKLIQAATPIDENVSENIRNHNKWVRKGLYSLLQNVLLLQTEETGPHEFFPRIELAKTTSFQELLPFQKHALYQLYINYFYERQEGLWSETALKRLPVLVNSTKMLCCGEDLGMVPACCSTVMSQLEILGLRIQRMATNPKDEFMHPGDYGYLTVAAPSSHDTATLRGWWEEDPDATQRFWNSILGERGAAPRHCTAEAAQKIFDQHVYSASMWAIFPLQDWFALNTKYFENRNPNDERINVPSNPTHYWSYRMHIPLEDLNKDAQFTQQIKDLLTRSGRA